MVYTERISKGEMTFDDKVKGVVYSKLIEGSIVESNNEFSDYLRSGLGGYPDYRRFFCPYMGEDADTVDEKFYENKDKNEDFIADMQMRQATLLRLINRLNDIAMQAMAINEQGLVFEIEDVKRQVRDTMEIVRNLYM